MLAGSGAQGEHVNGTIKCLNEHAILHVAFSFFFTAQRDRTALESADVNRRFVA
jgi:hypothetical protein